MFASFFLQILGLVALSMAMNKHYKSVFKNNVPVTLSVYLKVGGWSALVLSLVPVIVMAETPSIAMVCWFANLSLSIILTATFLCFGTTDKAQKKLKVKQRL